MLTWWKVLVELSHPTFFANWRRWAFWRRARVFMGMRKDDGLSSSRVGINCHWLGYHMIGVNNWLSYLMICFLFPTMKRTPCHRMNLWKANIDSMIESWVCTELMLLVRLLLLREIFLVLLILCLWNEMLWTKLKNNCTSIDEWRIVSASEINDSIVSPVFVPLVVVVCSVGLAEMCVLVVEINKECLKKFLLPLIIFAVEIFLLPVFTTKCYHLIDYNWLSAGQTVAVWKKRKHGCSISYVWACARDCCSSSVIDSRIVLEKVR